MFRRAKGGISNCLHTLRELLSSSEEASSESGLNLHSVCDEFESRIMLAVHKRINKYYPDVEFDYTIEELLDLPEWLSFEQWLFIKLRGRGKKFLFKATIDHIVPLAVAQTYEELIKLQSWKNLRLLDSEMNRIKSDKLDPENLLLGKKLLGRDISGYVSASDRDKDTKSDRFTRLMQRGKGQSQRMRVNGKEAVAKKKSHRSKKRRR